MQTTEYTVGVTVRRWTKAPGQHFCMRVSCLWVFALDRGVATVCRQADRTEAQTLWPKNTTPILLLELFFSTDEQVIVVTYVNNCRCLGNVPQTPECRGLSAGLFAHRFALHTLQLVRWQTDRKTARCT